MEDHRCISQLSKVVSMLCVFCWKLAKTPFLIARQNGQLDVVRWMLELGDDKDEARNIATTGLYIAAQNGDLDVVGFLTEAWR